MNYKYLYLSGFALIGSLIIFALHKEIIIINRAQTISTTNAQGSSQKKQVVFFYWNNAWHTDNLLMVIPEQKDDAFYLIINRWLQLVSDEKILKKKTALQSALISCNKQELFLSFDRAPWNKNSSIYEKWMIIEGILKTVKNSDSHIKKIYFLCDHAPMQDTHLDFTNAWPIDGFLK